MEEEIEEDFGAECAAAAACKIYTIPIEATPRATNYSVETVEKRVSESSAVSTKSADKKKAEPEFSDIAEASSKQPPSNAMGTIDEEGDEGDQGPADLQATHSSDQLISSCA